MPIPLSPFALLVAFCTGLLGAYLARKRGRNPYVWFFVGFFFGILGAMVIFFAPKAKKKPSPLSEPSKQDPLPSIKGPTDKFWYYLDPTHQQMGPMSLDALTSAWREGKISLTTYIWHEELSEWKFLKDCL